MKKEFQKNISGFTLIELLSVMIILAIVALITTPLVLDSIQTAKDGAIIESARGVVKSAELFCINQRLNDNVVSSLNNINSITYSGDTPESIDFLFDNDCNSTGTLTINGTTFSVSLNGDVEEITGLPENGDIKYIYDFANRGVNSTACLIAGQEFTHIEDKRDSKTYAVTKIGDQCWLAENLKYTNNGCLTNTFSSGMACRINGGSGWDKDEVLYQWRIAMNGTYDEGSQGLCPLGWHIPTKAEFETLISSVVVNNLVHGDWAGSNTYGFSFLPVGCRSWDISILEEVGTFSAILSSTYDPYSTGYYYPEVEYAVPFSLYLSLDPTDIFLYELEKDFSHSIRCLRD